VLEKYFDDIQETIRLANLRESVSKPVLKDGSKKSPNGIITLGDVMENPEHEKCDHALMEHLNSLDDECIHTMEILMLIGRENRGRKKRSGKTLFSAMQKYVDNKLGFGDKQAEINYISDKNPLGRYLETGIKLVCR